MNLNNQKGFKRRWPDMGKALYRNIAELTRMKYSGRVALNPDFGIAPSEKMDGGTTSAPTAQDMHGRGYGDSPDAANWGTPSENTAVPMPSVPKGPFGGNDTAVPAPRIPPDPWSPSPLNASPNPLADLQKTGGIDHTNRYGDDGTLFGDPHVAIPGQTADEVPETGAGDQLEDDGGRQETEIERLERTLTLESKDVQDNDPWWWNLIQGVIRGAGETANRQMQATGRYDAWGLLGGALGGAAGETLLYPQMGEMIAHKQEQEEARTKLDAYYKREKERRDEEKSVNEESRKNVETIEKLRKARIDEARDEAKQLAANNNGKLSEKDAAYLNKKVGTDLFKPGYLEEREYKIIYGSDGRPIKVDEKSGEVIGEATGHPLQELHPLKVGGVTFKLPPEKAAQYAVQLENQNKRLEEGKEKEQAKLKQTVYNDNLKLYNNWQDDRDSAVYAQRSASFNQGVKQLEKAGKTIAGAEEVVALAQKYEEEVRQFQQFLKDNRGKDGTIEYSAQDEVNKRKAALKNSEAALMKKAGQIKANKEVLSAFQQLKKPQKQVSRPLFKLVDGHKPLAAVKAEWKKRTGRLPTDEELTLLGVQGVIREWGVR